jgi:hypothetical protein
MEVLDDVLPLRNVVEECTDALGALLIGFKYPTIFV